MNEEKIYQQLQMVWPSRLLASPPAIDLAEGYSLRTYRPGDEASFYRVMDRAGFEDWNDEILRPWLAKILPAGWFFVEHQLSDQIVATAMTTHNPSTLHPFGGELSWVAADPAHRGNGLGTAVCSAVVARFLAAGYRNIYLKTDDWRLPALKIYLTLGFLPLLYTPEMEQRWQIVCQQLDWPFTPAAWPAPTADQMAGQNGDAQNGDAQNNNVQSDEEG